MFPFTSLIALALLAVDALARPDTGIRQGSSSGSYQDIVIYHHNIHRQNHSAPNVAWDAGLAASARIVALSCVFAHNLTVNGGGYGQNLAAGYESNNISAAITDGWYNTEVENFATLYGQASPSTSDLQGWGHFTQVVWASTFAVGCATQYCYRGISGVASNVLPFLTVCNYNLTGNVLPIFNNNVFPPQGAPVAHWNTGIF